MATVNGQAAIAWMQAKGTNVPGTCLNTVWQAFGSYGSIGPHAGQYPNAIDGWNWAEHKHPGDLNPPAGVPCYYGPSPTRHDSNAGAGDVVISIGGGMCIATDANGASGRIGTLSLAKRASDISRPYLGWTEDFLGYGVEYGAITNTITKKAIQEEDDMDSFYIGLSDPNSQKYYFSPRDAYHRAISAKEWEFLRAIEKAGGPTVRLVNVNQRFLNEVLADFK